MELIFLIRIVIRQVVPIIEIILEDIKPLIEIGASEFISIPRFGLHSCSRALAKVETQRLVRLEVQWFVIKASRAVHLMYVWPGGVERVGGESMGPQVFARLYPRHKPCSRYSYHNTSNQPGSLSHH